jgi:hypothetical protein
LVEGVVGLEEFEASSPSATEIEYIHIFEEGGMAEGDHVSQAIVIELVLADIFLVWHVQVAFRNISWLGDPCVAKVCALNLLMEIAALTHRRNPARSFLQNEGLIVKWDNFGENLLNWIKEKFTKFGLVA